MNQTVKCFFAAAVVCVGFCSVLADNPLFTESFAADPTARVFNGNIYLFPSHDVFPPNGGRGFYMQDYHVYSSSDLIDWTDHGVIVHQDNVEWVNPTNGMWAPDCVSKNGKYYFYFPANSNDTSTRRNSVQRVGVAIADKPEGPYMPEKNYIPGIPPGIDPCVLIDPKDGSAYLYYSMNAIFVAKLKDNMLEMETEPVRIDNLPTQGLVEGPFAFERNGIYYLTFPHDVGGGEALEYATADNPLGPFTMKGTIMGKNRACWTNHHSIVEYKGDWYLFYHDNEFSPRDDARRSARADYIHFNADGTIEPVIRTQRGVGICDAKRKIQIDRYSKLSDTGSAVEYLDNQKPAEGWKTVLSNDGAWVKYDRVDFGNGGLSSVDVRAKSAADATLEIGAANAEGPAITVQVPKSDDWVVVSSKLSEKISGVQNLVVKLKNADNTEIDWVRFK